MENPNNAPRKNTETFMMPVVMTIFLLTFTLFAGGEM